ncbi:hypothetical protein Q4512_13095 [Oceanihabitans sp. 2_MG-2023]|uniref:hypothetical protein n=1 Tax=Oceanihabitans sp. 2_MG-2023 TaxID=3062661 RepID=UPI0026E1EDC1|nr:hypothetical protein [Oceanihabitans sp. 2_MG-2023]MDO6597855.1 hypothetical protein [Oceanihabitans sp. 2_MG-2023]
MKNLKNIFKILTITLLVFSCDSDDSESITASSTAGFLVDNNDSSGVILGIPESGADLSDASIDFTVTDLDFDLKLEFGTLEGVEKIQIVKTHTSGDAVSDEVIAAETTTLPFNLIYSSIADYTSGLTLASESIRIGDEFTFRVKLFKTDGSIAYFNDALGTFSVIVNCASDLSGTYDVTTLNNTSGFIRPQGIEQIVEVSPGYYYAATTGTWVLGGLGVAPAATQGYNFQDTCNTITVPEQKLAQGFYGNDVFSHADGMVQANGDIVAIYTVTFDAGNNEYTSTYVKQ